jgi:DNA-binding NarL/FixJ family response regulator
VPFRVLIADDHAAVRGLLRVLLENHQDWQVCGEAENGFEAVVKASHLKPDLIILDLAMPVMDGLSAAREISSASPRVPILMHTSHNSPALDLEAKKAGVQQVVSKSGGGNDLLRAIEALMTRKASGEMAATVNVKTQAANQAASASGAALDSPPSGQDSKANWADGFTKQPLDS